MAHQLLILAAAATALVAPRARQAPRAAALQAKKTVFIDGESIDVLVYRDELVDADPFIRVFALANCEPIQ